MASLSQQLLSQELLTHEPKERQIIQIRKKEAYRPEIDGLRALAVSAVILNHLCPHLFQGGYLGVDVFFVISGYVITSSLESTPRLSLGAQLVNFYSRRIKRLLPALLVVAIVGGALIRLFCSDPRVSIYTGTLSIFAQGNLFLYWQATNYFGIAAQRNMFAHTWSLGIEEQFYLLYPLLLLWRRPKYPRSISQDPFRLAALSIISVTSLILFIAVYRVNQPAAYFLMPFRFWELGIGCLLALTSGNLMDRGLARPFKLSVWISAAAGACGILEGGRYPITSTILVVIATATLIGRIQKGEPVYRMLSSAPFTYLGKISYSLYLWHWIVICTSFWTIGIHVWSIPFQLALIFGIAAASYHLIENPLRRAHWTARPLGVPAIGIASMAAVAGLVCLMQASGYPTYCGEPALSLASAVNSPLPGYVAPYSHRRADDCFAEHIATGRAHLHKNLEKCSAGKTEALKLFFIGDSHSMDLIPMADQIYEDGVASVANVFQPGCRIPMSASEPKVCNYDLSIVSEIAQDPAQKKVLVIRQNYSPREIDGELSQFSRGFEALLARTSAAGISVIYFLPSPIYYSMDSLCAPQWFRPAWAMGSECRNGFREDRNEQLARRRDIAKYMKQLSQRRKDLYVFDPFDVLCGRESRYCSPLRDGRSIYRDSSHLTGEGSELLTRPFEAFLESNHFN